MQTDFDRLTDYGASYITVFGPGIFKGEPPFAVDQEIVTQRDNLLERVARADLFATIAFRRGSGRSEYYLCCSGDSYFEGYFNDTY